MFHSDAVNRDPAPIASENESGQRSFWLVGIERNLTY